MPLFGPLCWSALLGREQHSQMAQSIIEFYTAGTVIPAIALAFALESAMRTPKSKVAAAIDGLTKALIWGLVNGTALVYFSIYVIGHK